MDGILSTALLCIGPPAVRSETELQTASYFNWIHLLNRGAFIRLLADFQGSSMMSISINLLCTRAFICWIKQAKLTGTNTANVRHTAAGSPSALPSHLPNPLRPQ